MLWPEGQKGECVHTPQPPLPLSDTDKTEHRHPARVQFVCPLSV